MEAFSQSLQQTAFQPTHFGLRRQGRFVALPILFSAAGLVLVSIGGFSCEIFSFTFEDEDGYVMTTKYGYTGVMVSGGCDTYKRSYSLQAGYASAILATVFGCIAAVAVVLTAFVRFPPRAILGMSISAFVVAAFGAAVCGMAFAVEECRVEGFVCKPAPMMYVTMIGTLSWVAAGATLQFVAKHEREAVVVRGGSDAAATPEDGAVSSAYEPL
jgi:hypothetical protein